MNFKFTRLGRIATAALATAMLAGVMSTSALAAGLTEDKDTDGTYKAITSFSIGKVIESSAHVKAPNTNVTLNIANANATSGEEKNGTPVYSGSEADGLVTFTAATDTTKASNVISFTSSTTASADYKYTGSATFNFDTTKVTKPGIYKYKVSESMSPAVEGMTTASDKTLYVYVRNKLKEGSNTEYSGYEVYATSLVDTTENASTSTAKSGAFTNVYKSNDDTEKKGELREVTITKNITGAAANQKGSFTFTVKVTKDSNNTDGEYEGVYLDENGSEKTGKGSTASSEGGQFTVTLKNGESFKIFGISKTDKVEVKENAAGEDGYTTTYKIDAAETGTKVESTANDFVTVTSSETNSDTNDHAIVFENNKETVTPTGIVMNIAPYAAMIAVAVAGCFVFLRRRRED